MILRLPFLFLQEQPLQALQQAQETLWERARKAKLSRLVKQNHLKRAQDEKWD